MIYNMRRARRFAAILLAAFIITGLVEVPANASPDEAAVSEAEWEVMRLINDYRLKNGSRPLSATAALSGAAGMRAAEIGEFFSHNRPDGTRFSTVFAENGLRYYSAGENIGSGQQTPERIVDAWIASAPHEKSMVNNVYYHIGVGYMTGGSYSPAWAQDMLSYNCSIESMAVTGTRAYCRVGSDIREVLGCIEVLCSEHGLCHMPISSAMCTGFDTSRPGDIAVTVTVEGFEDRFDIRVIDSVQLPALDPRAESVSGNGNAMPFADIGGDDFYCRDVLYLYECGVMDGVSASRFDADGLISRAMAAKLLYELSGAPTVSGPSGFSDVSDDDWFAPAVIWAARNGVVNGVGGGLFDPEGLVTREQLAAMLHRLIGFPAAAPREWDRELSDRRQVSGWAYPAVEWVLESGIMNAGVDMAFSPKGAVSRAECAMILAGFHLMNSL